MRYENEIVGIDAAKEEQPDEARKQNAEKIGSVRSTLLLVRDVAVAVAILVIILQFYKPTIVFEHSMEHTLHPEDYVFLAKKAYVFEDVKFGQIIVFESGLIDEHGGNKNLIKRAIGLPGDTIEVKDDAVYRNGERLYEPYVKGGVTPGIMAPVEVPPDSYFVLGDNRKVSMDSRTDEVGFVPEDKIRGKIVYRLFPLSNAGVIR